jgi:TolB-like protein
LDLLNRLRSVLADRYAVHREIGRGGMAVVFLAADLKHHRDVAIKVLKPEFGFAVSSDRFLREIQIEAQLKHPYILPLFDSGEADGLLYYVMPYVTGDSLRARLAEEIQLPLDEAVRICTEVAEALSYAHARGIVHRDVKPGNILLDESHALLADFGIARVVSELGGEALSQSGLAVGTPEYMSPEQCSNRGKIDGRSDIYALGCVLYEMLSGEPPFTGPTVQAIIARHLHDQPRSLRAVRSTIPEHVEEAIQVALAKIPADRFATANRFVAALTQEGETVTAVRRARMARRRRIRRTAGLLAGIVGAVGVGVWAFTAPRSASSDGLGDAATPAPISSIAVLYFEDRSRSGDLDYLSTGLTEDLIDQLARVKSLRVISPNGVRPYRGRDPPLDSLSRVLQVGTIVTGSLDRADDRLRASVRLLDAKSGVQLHSGTLEKPAGDVLVLRDEMADEVARQLRIRLGEVVELSERRAGTKNAAAWDLLLRAEQMRNQAQEFPGSESAAARSVLREADSMLVVAERLDTSWSEPTILRGWLAYDQADRAADVMDTTQSASAAIERWIAIGISRADRALLRHPANPEALELRGTLLYRSWALTGLYGIRDTLAKLERAERDLRRAASVQHRHQARALSTLSAVLEFSGKVAEASLAAERAYEADAYLRDASGNIFRAFNTSLDMKRYADAEAWCERGRRAFPNDWTFLMCQLSLLGWSPNVAPDVDSAWGILRQLSTVVPEDALVWLSPQMTMMVAAVVARAGLADSAERVIARTKKTAAPDPQLPYYEAHARVRLNQPEVAAELIHGLVQRSPNLLQFFRSRTAFEPLWDDPRLRHLR